MLRGLLKMNGTQNGIFLHCCGMTAFLAQQAIMYPRSMIPLVARILPLQINVRTEKPTPVVYKTVEECRAALKARGFDDQTIDAMMGSKRLPPGVTPKMIEHIQQQEDNEGTGRGHSPTRE